MCNCGGRICDEECPCFLERQRVNNLTKAGIILASGIGLGVCAMLGIPAAATAMGFTEKGVNKGSPAASTMSKLGTRNAVVPTLQSIGATGKISKSTAVGVGVAGGAVAAAVMSALDPPERNFCSNECNCRCAAREVRRVECANRSF